ncbi:catechol 2,3-dioxygenase-like lactoylglutathione lyase family enzyme [Acinetobacter calcoaceticus]|uniref:Catechol 2,3-dioxygenase-like lactoylglutathione lyase family enzyme n=1 Tax=Acinetobacter calcoaceticus TaxID=471 RepID=A0A4R1XW68_ACICA|nr:catechol 2,3-dioxygenase-like lactoylglutathione lyase family enzyme [Acinetobacter calcoaceticus]
MNGLSFSHVGIYVTDMPKMQAFYCDVLGFFITDQGQLETPKGTVQLVFLSRDPKQHHQIVLVSERLTTEHGFNPINQISLEADSLETLQGFYTQFKTLHISNIDPITHGNAISFYAPDPEGNRLELFIHTPWYDSQPMKQQIDLSLSSAEIMQIVENHARKLSGFCSRAEWESRMQQLMSVDALEV